MWIAVISDVHGNVRALQRALEDLRAQGATAIINLGDLGEAAAHQVLAPTGARSIIGNWEVSFWPQLPPRWQQEVRQWAFTLQEGPAIFCHASPVWPETVRTLEDAARYVQEHGSWFALFPDLNKDEEARWEAFALLAQRRCRIAFHGHTHVQKAWVLTPDNRMRPVRDNAFTLEDEPALYLVGVGSVGRPLDGPGICYALWNPQTREVRLRRLEEA